ncbi:hypothetical protein [Variovorax sp. PBL-E5]|uniref:TubC N-terminal docking domain-related protein n=1 Tax=Variovorax sp. PBL-E5 TaxID=434014 RepID=UPI001315E2DD|nr:hypothetical protein [Variovorax sp. PBL-E5]VTU36231.1 hypothetical protein E5CHR_04261 [Variovorax sp. PBL-E5]
MTPELLIRMIEEVGLTIRADGDTLVVAPAEKLTADLRGLLKHHKPRVLAFLHEIDRLTADLIAGAMRACDRHGDGPAARADMVRDCNATPIHLQADLLDHFRQTYGGKA